MNSANAQTPKKVWNSYMPPMGLLFDHMKNCGCFALTGLAKGDIKFDRTIRFMLKIFRLGLLSLPPIRIIVKIKIVDHLQCKIAHGNGKRFSIVGRRKSIFA